MTSRTQRYRVTAEFSLLNRGDYETYRQMIHNFFASLGCRLGCQFDFLSIEKVKSHDSSKD